MRYSAAMPKKTQIPLDTATLFAAALGRLSGHWAIVEWELSNILAGLLGVGSGRAALVYQTFFSIPQKVELLERLVLMFVENSTQRAALLRLLKQALDLERKRTGFMHSAWAVGRTEDSLHQVSSSMPRNPDALKRAMRDVPVAEVNEVVEQMAVLSAELQWFSFDSFSKLTIHSEPSNLARAGS
jgi:hypothetical protein